MGKHIVYEEFPKEPGKCGKLWSFEDINDVLTENMGTKAIQGVVLKLQKQKEAYWNPECFSKVLDLKLLIIDNVHLLREPKYLPNALSYLDWSGYPSKYFPSSFQQKPFDSLKFIKLKESLKLIETPNFNEIPNLEKLVLKGCTSLHSLHPSIGVHQKLTFLNLKGCKNLRSLPRKLEMESLEILILSSCSNFLRIPEFGENMTSVSRLYLDGTAITKLPTSIGNLTGLALLNVKDCKNLMSLPSTFFNMKWLKVLNLSGCSKLENLVTVKSVEEVDVSGTATGLVPYSNALFQTLKNLALGGFKPRSPNRMGLLSTSLLGLCSLTSLNLSYCNLNAIPNDICRLFSLEKLCLNGNNFGYLPENMTQLSRLYLLEVNNCTSLRSWPKLPLNIDSIWGKGCTSLETLPGLFPSYSLSGRHLFFTNCSTLAENDGFIDCELLLFEMITSSLLFPERVIPGSDGMFDNITDRYGSVFPGSKIPKWFRHQRSGDEVSIQEPNSLFCNEWIGIAVCVVFCSHPHHQIAVESSLAFYLIVNGFRTGVLLEKMGDIVPLLDHTWLLYLLPQYYEKRNINIRALLVQYCDANGFSQIGISIKARGISCGKVSEPLLVKKCGLQMIYKKDMKYLIFDNSMAAAAEGYEAQQTRDEYDGAGSSNYEPHPERIERLTDFMAEESSEESSEYEECAEELGD